MKPKLSKSVLLLCFMGLCMNISAEPVKWPRLLKDGKARVVLLKHGNHDWQKKMVSDRTRNLLLWYRELSGLAIASGSEALTPEELRRTQDEELPPLVYLAGKPGTAAGASLSKEEIDILRWYCREKGGMILADCVDMAFDESFRKMMRAVFPDSVLQDIADDDVLYRQPYTFEKGAPPLWHHSGDRALGIKDHDRWVVFYHPGDIGDAWRDGHSGIREETAILAYKMGINIIYYAYSRFEENQNTGAEPLPPDRAKPPAR